MGQTSNNSETESARLGFLSRLSLFSGLPAPVLMEVARAAKPRTWLVNTFLFQRGDPSTALIAMKSGRVRTSLRTFAGRELILQDIQGETVIGEVGLLDGSPHAADATVISEVTGYVVDGRLFSSLLGKHPELARSAILHLCGVLRNTTYQFESIALYEIDARVARFLLARLPADGTRLRDPNRLVLDLNQSEIADLIGSSRPKVNRAMMTLEKTGAIVRKGRFLTCDRAKLKRVATEIGREHLQAAGSVQSLSSPKPGVGRVTSTVEPLAGEDRISMQLPGPSVAIQT